MTAVVVLIIAVILGFLVLKLVFGILKLVLIAAIVIGALAYIGRKVG